MTYAHYSLIFSYRYAAPQLQAFVWRRRSRWGATGKWYTETATISGWKGTQEADQDVHDLWMKTDAARNRQAREAERLGISKRDRGWWKQ